MPVAKPQPIDLDAMIAGIRRWVEIESPTSDAAAVNRMIDEVVKDLAGLKVAIERVKGTDGYADNLIVRTPGAGEKPGVLVLSHIDTVHPVGMIKKALPFRQEGDRLYGPGLYDMKGGAYMALQAFRRVVEAGSNKLPITFLFTPDEEVGSPTSRPLIEAAAKHTRYTLVTEPARDGGKVVTSRKGVGRFDLMAVGVPAHSGGRHERGRSAIKEVACQVLAIEGMTDYARGITTNIGTIAGGTAANVVPQYCQISIDLRVVDEASGREMSEKILGLKAFDPDVKVTVTGAMNRPPYEKTAAGEALFKHAQALASDLGFALVDSPRVGGGSDGNFTAALGIATLDGLGIDGDGAHTDWEHGLVSSIVPRTLLMQRLMETLE
jgi:glutamate carboxypeptidase